MWETSAGPRKLGRHERAVFLESVLSLYDFLRDEDAEVGVAVFDRIPVEDRPTVLLWVADQVLGAAPPPPIRAWSAGTIAAVFGQLETMLHLEIETEEFLKEASPSTTWRRLVREAWMERCFPEIDLKFKKGEGDKQPFTSRDQDEWEGKIECLAGEMLKDSDYEVEAIMDVPADRAKETKDYLGIPNDYYTEAPPSFSLEDRQRLLAFHRGILREASPA